jgi:Caenorhabditis protein of unknown function, DUF268
MITEIPKEMYDGYSMNGKVEIHENYVMSGSNRRFYHYSEDLVNQCVAMGNNRQGYHYPETDKWFYEALDKHNIEQKQFLIIGSEDPYYEGIAISRRATVTMVEYQRVTSSHPFLTTMTVEEFEKEDYQYDGAISISSVEHSGLGRYGDPLDPDGDLKSMKFLHQKLKKGALLFLSVPIGKDQILWNAHRVYGRERFPLLIDGFKIIDTFGLVDSDYDVDEHQRRLGGKIPHREGCNGGAHQPIYVLKRI